MDNEEKAASWKRMLGAEQYEERASVSKVDLENWTHEIARTLYQKAAELSDSIYVRSVFAGDDFMEMVRRNKHTDQQTPLRFVIQRRSENSTQIRWIEYQPGRISYKPGMENRLDEYRGKVRITKNKKGETVAHVVRAKAYPLNRREPTINGAVFSKASTPGWVKITGPETEYQFMILRKQQRLLTDIIRKLQQFDDLTKEQYDPLYAIAEVDPAVKAEADRRIVPISDTLRKLRDDENFDDDDGFVG